MPLLTVSSSSRPTSGIRAALALVGLTAVIGQIVLMRELIVVFNGNEISLGVVLATWLLWTAVGSSLASHFALWQSRSRRTVAALECLLGISLLPSVWAVRASRAFFQTVHGELVGPVPMLLTCLVCLSVFCVLSGALFVVATRVYQQEHAVTSSLASSSGYLLEAAGSAVGGTLASLVLLRSLESFQIAAVVAVLNLCMAAILLVGLGRKQVMAVVLVGVCLTFPLLIYVAPLLLRSSQAHLWQRFRLLESRDSIYGNLAIIETGSIRSIYDNGIILANAPDEAGAEEAVHYALLEHPAPRRILLIGGGANGSVAEALKHPTVEQIDYVELDPMLISMAKQYFPAQVAPLVGDRRVRTHIADGRLYLRTSRDRFDVITVSLPDPQTAQLNRFYTIEFFQTAREHLTAGGLLALQLRASEDYISPELAEFLRCIDHTLRGVFPYVIAIPGESFHFFAAMQPNVLTDDPQALIVRLRQRNIQTQYVREYFIPFRMMPDRMAQVRQLLQPMPETPVNRDFEPIAYYFDVMLWGAQFKDSYYGGFVWAGHFQFIRVVVCTLIVLLLTAACLAYIPGREKRLRATTACCMAATGFTLMALQIFVLLAFQSIYGYVYHQLAILIGMFMAGIALGSWLGLESLRHRIQNSFITAAALTQFLLALSAPMLLLTVTVLARTSSAPAAQLVAQLAFPALAALCGMAGGYQFSIATQIYLRDDRTKRGLGVLYAVDLLGGCAGALLLSSYLIPVFGFWKTAWLTAAVNLAPAILAMRASRESKASRA